MTLDDLEQCNSLCIFSPNLIALPDHYVTVVEDRTMMSVNIVCQFQSSTFGINYSTLQCGLSAIAEHLVMLSYCAAVVPFTVFFFKSDIMFFLVTLNVPAASV